MKDETKIIFSFLIFGIMLWIPLTIACAQELFEPILKKEINPIRQAYLEEKFKQARCMTNVQKACETINKTLIEEYEKISYDCGSGNIGYYCKKNFEM